MARKSMAPRTTLYFRGISQHLKDQWKAFCARRGKKMTARLVELMRKDIQRDARFLSPKRTVNMEGEDV